jgi:DNA-binding GntR family transcriptional regulator
MELHTVYSMHMRPSLLDRPNISDSLVDALRHQIVDGRLPAGERINEVHLARSLGVSRTPLREALGRLAAEGAVRTVPRIGFFASPLSVEEVEQVYPIRALLDPEALRLAGIPSVEGLRRLRDLNRDFRKARVPDEAINLDDAWHRELLAGCPNRILLDLIEQFIRRTRRYEIALLREGINVLASAKNHEEILAALRSGDLPGACAALRRNMQIGIAPIVSWLKQREAEEREE